MVWKSNLNEQEQENIEEFGNVGANAPTNTTGGIQSNRKTKNVGQTSKMS